MGNVSIVVSLGVVITLLGYVVGRKEGWSSSESLYWYFITATTVGYADIRPVQNFSRIIAIVIAFLGLTLSGIIIALAVHAGTIALRTVGAAS